MNCLIVAGGSLDDEFALRCLRDENYEYTIAADAGLGFFRRNDLVPDLIVGDFDSAGEEMLADFSSELIRLSPIKDDTDSEHAIREAIHRGAASITMLGATTGKRIDHLLGNIALLGIGIEAGVPITLLDPHNRIRMYTARGHNPAVTTNNSLLLENEIDLSLESNYTSIKIGRKEQYSRFLSLIPYCGKVTGVTLTGVKYPLNNYTMEEFSSLGISNEITEDEACISFYEGVLLLIESSD